MRLFIAEKPSLARAIASVLSGSREDMTGYIRVGQDCVTWCYGHLLELAEPKEYDPAWAKWNTDHLPYKIREWRVRPKSTDGVLSQLKVIQKLLSEAKEVVNAGDPDREGQMLVDEILDHFGVTGIPVKRLLLNATDPGSARKAVASLRQNKEFGNLYESAKCRSRADWLVGMNLTVAATKWLADDTLVSIGRVQTPTLALVVRRDLEIEEFRTRKFYDIEVDIQTGNGMVTLRYSPKDEARIWERTVALETAHEMVGKSVSMQVETREVSERPPKLYTLASFQKDAGKIHKWGAKHALDLLQGLYERQLTSYPRTECEYLPAEQQAEAKRLGEMIISIEPFSVLSKQIANLAPRGYIYDSSKVAEHHAIIVTGKRPDIARLDLESRQAWELVARRFLMSLLPDYRYRETKIAVRDDGRQFVTRGEIPLNFDSSWLALGNARRAIVLPAVCNGELGLVKDARPVEGKTTPPEPYTEGTLIEDMNSVAKYVTDPRLKKILKENSGIGTAATQASIIETLKKRGYVETINGKLRSTAFGRSVVAVLPAALLDPGLTAAWEEALKKMAHGDYEPEEFMRRVELFVEKRLVEMRNLRGQGTITKPASPLKQSPSEPKSSPAKSSSRPARRACI